MPSTPARISRVCWPSSGGATTSTSRYRPTRLASGRLRLTFQIWLNAFSTVSSIATAVTSRKAEPASVRLPALAANWCRVLSTVRAMPSGSRLFSRCSSRAASKRANAGKRVNSAKLTASSGTTDSKVVNDRLPATCSRRSCRARRKVRASAVSMRDGEPSGWNTRGGS